MNNFEIKLLNKLIDKYEKSKLSKGGTKNNKSIRLTTKDEVLSSYTVVDSYKYTDDNDVILKKLEKLGFISTEYYEDTFKSLTLIVENVDSIYDYLNRCKPSDELMKIEDVLNKYKFDNFVNDFIVYIYEYIEKKYDYPKSYFTDSENLNLILKTFTKLFMLEEEIKKRDFSARYLGDSKLFETIENKIIKIIKDFDSKEELNSEEILSAYNIVKNSSYVLVKNKLNLKINDSLIKLDDLRFEMSLSDDMIKRLEILSSNVKKVITVENLTSFYTLVDDDAVIIYLGGFHNHTKQLFLKMIHEKYPNAEYLHFGDIDAGGIWIFENLRYKTGIPFHPFRMDIEELSNKNNNFKKLTEHDKSRLSKMLEDSRFEIFKEVIIYMLNNNIKLEQENIEI